MVPRLAPPRITSRKQHCVLPVSVGLGRVLKIYITLGWVGSITQWVGLDWVQQIWTHVHLCIQLMLRGRRLNGCNRSQKIQWSNASDIQGLTSRKQQQRKTDRSSTTHSTKTTVTALAPLKIDVHLTVCFKGQPG